jgi:hypothetical protein
MSVQRADQEPWLSNAPLSSAGHVLTSGGSGIRHERATIASSQSMTTITQKRVYDNILEAIGDTPMVRINRITEGITKATVLAKIETFNPGNSIKDRMAIRMIEDAEQKGLLKPGGTNVRQYRHGARDSRRRQGVSVRVHHDGQAIEGEGRRAEGVWRRGDCLPD